MKIRLVKKDEWQALQKLNNEVFVDNAQYDPDIIPDWAYSPAGEAYYKELAASDKSVCYVVEENEVLVGYIAASPKEFDYRKSTYLEIDNMGVLPSHRSQGIGAALINQIKAWAQENGFQKLFVVSYAANNHAIRFYKRAGFSEIDLSLEMVL